MPTYFNLEVDRDQPSVEYSDDNDWESIQCAVNPGHQRAGRRITELRVDLLTANVPDFSRTMLSDIVVSSNALMALRRSGLTGYREARAPIVHRPPTARGGAAPVLWELVVTGRGGPAHPDSGIVTLVRCEACGLVRHSTFRNGIVVDPSTYDGSDFFYVDQYPRYVLVSERAKEAIEGARLTNVRFTESYAASLAARSEGAAMTAQGRFPPYNGCLRRTVIRCDRVDAACAVRFLGL